MTNPCSDAPLALDDLRPWLLPATCEWIRQADEAQAAWQAENETEMAGNGASLFASEDDEEEEKDPYKYRVRAWCTSQTNPDGIFSQDASWHGGSSVNGEQNGDKQSNDDGVRIIYILSESWQGYGDILWASARHVSNLLGHAESCRTLLHPSGQERSLSPLLVDDDYTRHPLWGRSFLELGAGAGVPSMVAMQCGARVVCTDQAVPDRIRSIAECFERNFRQIQSRTAETSKEEVVAMAQKARACAHDWGGSIDQVLQCLDENRQERFDVVVAADCCYMPWLQPQLLESIYQLLSDKGVALLSFALHGNAKDEVVWGVVDRAKEKGFETQVLEPKQLTPPTQSMDSKQGLVQTIRLSKLE